jgi:predicted DNA-binding antitoxin AbrB/MazE fold protein
MSTIEQAQKMQVKVDAVYEEGVFKPVHPLTLSEGSLVQIVITTEDSAGLKPSAAKILADIAALPLESEVLDAVGRNHDTFLYGRDEKR